MLAGVEPDSAVAAARVELAGELLDDLQRVDYQITESKKRPEQVVAASGTSVIHLFGVGPVVAATVVGVTGDIARFPTRAPFAAFNGTAPIEVSSGGRKIWRLSRRGNRTLNHAIHMAAVTQLRFAHSPGRGYYDRKIADGKTPKEALRALKRRINNALWAAMVADAHAAAATKASTRETGPGRRPGNDSVASAAGSHPETPALRPSHSRTRNKPTTATLRRARRSTRSTSTTARGTA